MVFRENARSYNNSLAFTAVSCKEESRLDADTNGHRNPGPTCFQIHGELYHYTRPLHRSPGGLISNAQWLFYDQQDAVRDLREVRTRIRPDILAECMDILRGCNPYISLYKHAREPLDEQPGSQAAILANPRLELLVERGADRRRENLPTADEVAVLIPDETESTTGQRDLVPAYRQPQGNDSTKRVHATHPLYMPLAYVLLFPKGEPGWHWGLSLHGNQRQNTRLEQQQFYRYRLHPRNGERSVLFYAKRLFQQYVVDVFASCEKNRLNWFRSIQRNIRADAYRGLMDAMAVTDHLNPADQGRQVILPASFTSGDRFMQKCYQDSMTIVRKLGKPDLFITFTANPQ